ncbi:Syntaxin 6 protein [Rutstroemia sp. NJR-2017a WRK4]|nr:Syntaxin 6 protein [Rutstroemia sp. NJR-2017a WRK4]
MSSTNEDDPFLQVQADVLHQLSLTRPLFTSYLRIHSLTKSPHPTPELLSARSDLTSSLSLLTDDLSDLRDSIAAIQSDPYKYGLQVEEVARRVRLIEEIGGEVDDMREELEKTMKKSRGGSTNANSYDSATGGGEAEDSDYAAEFEHQQQLQIMKEQDEQLESVFHTVGNLRQQADDMGRELEEQTGMLAEVETVTDRVSGRLQGGMKRMNKLVRDNEDPLSSCCIGVLIFILILLLILVLVL